MYRSGYEFDKTFEPSPSHINFIRGIFVGACESPGLGGEWFTEGTWIQENMPINNDFRDLYAVGWILEDEQLDAYFSYGLASEAVNWAQLYLGLPDDDMNDASIAWVETVLTPTFERQKKQVKGLRGPCGVRSCTEIVSNYNYTPEEAASAKAEIDRKVEKSELTRHSAAVYKAHISRRTNVIV